MIQSIGSFKFYATYYGKDDQGVADDTWEGAPLGFARDVHDDSDDDDSVPISSIDTLVVADISNHKSKIPIKQFLERLMNCAYEQSLLRIVRDYQNKYSGKLCLDFTKVNPITKELKGIQQLYDDDFKVVVPAATTPAQPPAVSAEITQMGGLILQELISSEKEYNIKLADWKKECQQAEDSAYENYLNSRVAWVIGTDPTKLCSKALAVSCVKESKKKLFFMDMSVMRPMDWERLKKQKKGSATQVITFDSVADIYDSLFQVYQSTRTQDDSRKSADVVVVLTPAPALHHCENKGLRELLKKIKALIPKHISPKVGEVERQVKAKGSLMNLAKDHITCTSEQKLVIPAKNMEHLSGNTRFNKWVVPPIDDPATAKADLQGLFPADAEVFEMEADSADDMSDNELKEDLVIPYPHEKHHKFGMELIQTFQPDVVIHCPPPCFCPPPMWLRHDFVAPRIPPMPSRYHHGMRAEYQTNPTQPIPGQCGLCGVLLGPSHCHFGIMWGSSGYHLGISGVVVGPIWVPFG